MSVKRSPCAVRSREVDAREVDDSSRAVDVPRAAGSVVPTTPISTPLWTLTNVSLGRDERRLNAASLEIVDGVTAVIGPSGAGKTSLLNLLVGFERPEGGAMTSAARSVDDRLPIGWVPPDFGLWPHLTVRQHLKKVSCAHVCVDGLLAAFGLSDLSKADVGRLSQGERSRVAVARALASDPTVLVMDEPLVHVDPVTADESWRVIREQCRSRNTSLIFSTHSPERVLREAGRVICLDEGRIAYDGEVAALYDSPPSARVARFLGPVNWFNRDEKTHWLAGGSRQTDHALQTNDGLTGSDVCVRPERLDVMTTDASGFVVRSSVATASGAVSEIEDEEHGDRRTVYHRATEEPLTVGTRVLLRVCVSLLMGLLVTGCQQSKASPTLAVVSSRTLKMPADGARIPAPRSLAVSDEGELYVLDKAGRVLVYGADGSLDRQWMMPEFDVGKPEGVCLLSDGRVAVADTHYHRIVIFDRKGVVAGMFGELGEQPGQFIYPVSITRDDAGHLYVAEYGGNDRIQKFTTEGEWLLTIGGFGTEAGEFQRPSGVVWREGTLYVADAINNRVQSFADDGTYLKVVAGWGGSGVPSSTLNVQHSTLNLDYPYDIALGPNGQLFVVEYGAGRVTSMTVEGRLIGRYGANGRGDGEFWTPWGIAVGRDGRIFVADTGNKRIVELGM